MTLKNCLGILGAVAVLAAGCLNRKQDGDAAMSGEAGAGPDLAGIPPVDTSGAGVDVSSMNRDSGPTLDVGQEIGTVLDTGVDAPIDAAPDLPQGAETGLPDAPTDPFVPPPADLGAEKPVVAEVGADFGLDVPLGPEAGPDLAPTTCTIGGTSYASDAPNPANTCQVCKPALSLSAWSSADEGKVCGAGQYCNAGTCKPGCFISGSYYANTAANPLNACQTCQTASATTSWTVGINGTTCGSGQVCSGGTCQSGCWIGGVLVNSGTTNTANVCQICKPTSSTSGWSNNDNGTSCGNGQICGNGACQSGCYVSGSLYDGGVVNPVNPCQTCQPLVATLAFTQIAATDCSFVACGSNHSCALANGTAKCWGANFQGQLGVGSTATTEAHTATSIAGLNTGGQAISAGSSHTCELVGGSVQCWGWNITNQMGNTSVTDSNVVSPVAAAAAGGGVQGLAGGGNHNCVLKNGGAICWGSNSSGQLGNNSAGGDSATGVTVFPTGSGVQAVTAGTNHSCALVGGAVQCWGYNGLGDLGDNTTSQRSLPVPVQGLSGTVQAIASGSSSDHTCAIINGYVYCWGWNVRGQLGDNTTTQRNTAVQVQSLGGNVQAVAVGVMHTCALTGGAVYCWGLNDHGQLGNSSVTESWVPMAVSGVASGAKAIACGRTHSCAVVGSGVKCWGNNANGQLGNNSTSDSSTPVSVQGL